MLRLSLICCPFSKFQGLNYFKMDPGQVEDRLRAGVFRRTFTMAMCKLQSDKRRMLMFEHPSVATPWVTETVRNVLKLLGVMIVDVDFCKCGMKSSYANGEGLAKTRAGVMIHSLHDARRLTKAQCRRDRIHVPSVNPRASPCRHYPQAVCGEICMAVTDELLENNLGERCNIMTDLAVAMGKIGGTVGAPLRMARAKVYLTPAVTVMIFSTYHGMGFFDGCARVTAREGASYQGQKARDGFI